jgi:hypothetical protein
MGRRKGIPSRKMTPNESMVDECFPTSPPANTNLTMAAGAVDELDSPSNRQVQMELQAAVQESSTTSFLVSDLLPRPHIVPSRASSSIYALARV